MSKQQSMWKLSALLGCTALAGIMACTVTTTDGPNTGDDDDDTTSSSSSSSSSSGATSSSSGEVDSGAEKCNVPVPEGVDLSACGACLEEKCPTETTACYCDSGNTECRALEAAYTDCNTQYPDASQEAELTTCLDAADAAHPNGGADLEAWVTCATANCSLCLGE